MIKIKKLNKNKREIMVKIIASVLLATMVLSAILPALMV